MSAQMSIAFSFNFPLLRRGALSNSLRFIFLNFFSTLRVKGWCDCCVVETLFEKEEKFSFYMFPLFNNRNVHKSIIQKAKKFR